MPVETPSGTIFSDRDVSLAWELAEVGFIRWENQRFTLKSRIESHVYVFGRQDLTDNVRCLKHVGTKIAETVQRIITDDSHMEDVVPCLIGVPMAGNALAQAAAFQATVPMCFRVMRPMKKSYGAHTTWVDGGPDPLRHQYFTIDNVVTDGASKLEAVERLEEDGYPARDMTHLILVDRGQGGMEKLRAEGLNVVSIFNLLDLAFVFMSQGRWTRAQYEAVSEEIAAHQF